MKLEIVSGQPKLRLFDLEDKFDEILVQDNIRVESAYITDTEKCILRFPETEILHPKTLYDSIKMRVRNHIESDKDLFILTYSSIVLYAVRVEIKNYEFKGAKCHQFLNDGTDKCAVINENGQLSYWEEDIFDTIECALDELLDL